MSRKRSVDYVIVGAGSSGCVVANRLSANSACTVLLLEAGQWDNRPDISRVDAMSVLALLNSDWSSQMDWGYVTEPEPGLKNRRIPVARGRVVGGCSSINALMWVRGSRFDYDSWSSFGNTGWAFNEILPYFKRAEDYDGAASTFRGVGGPLSVRKLQDPSPIAQAFLAATQDLGYSAPDLDYNGPEQEGFGFYYQTTRTRDGRRCSTATAYLHPYRNRANMWVKAGAQATRLHLDRGRVAEVEYLQDGQLQSVIVDGEVILSCGAFETPKLLMISGIGRSKELEKHGIKCRHDLSGVGQNLQDHLFVPVCYQSSRQHPAGALISEAGLFTRTPHGTHCKSSDLQLAFGPVKFLPEGTPAAQWEGPGFTFAPAALHPQSRGEVTLRDSDPLSSAIVRANYLTAEADLDSLIYGVNLARELAQSSRFNNFRGDELGLGEQVKSDSEVRQFVRANATTLWHPVGTCRMGNDSNAVVNSDLQVHGVDGLRIADASIMPDIVSGNTNAACVMIGEKTAALIEESHRR